MKAALYSLATAWLLPGLCDAQLAFKPRDPEHEPPGAQWNYVHNEGQTYHLNGTLSSAVVIQSVGTTPSLYMMKDSQLAATYANPADSTVARIDLRFIGEGSNPSVPTLHDLTGHHYNFYEEHTPNGVTDVEAGKWAAYADVYDSIDVHVSSNAWGPKFYIVVRPGGDPEDLRLQISGHDSLHLDISGDLKIWFDNKYLRLREGYAYQQMGDSIIHVPWVAHYVNQDGSTQVTFDLGGYDPDLPLVLMIKPWVPPSMGGGQGPLPEWSTYFAGNPHSDYINDLAHDGDGYVYFTGSSKSSNGLPATSGLTTVPAGGDDVIIGRINPNYEITSFDTWMTYYGAIDNDRGTAIAYTSTAGGRLAVCGLSGSPTNLLVQPMGDSWTMEGYNLLALFNPVSGERTYSTRLPHANYVSTEDMGRPSDLDYDDAGNLYLVGYDWIMGSFFNDHVTGPAGSADYTSQAYFNQIGTWWHDAYVARFDAGMHLTWLTALGGPHDDQAFACTVDKELGRLVVVGKTASKNNTGIPDCPANGFGDFPLCFPTVGDCWHEYLLNGPGNCDDPNACGTDGFVTVFDLGDLHILYSSYFGSGHGDREAVTDVITDPGGNIYLTGWTNDGATAAAGCQWNPVDGAWIDCNAGGYMDPATNGGFYGHFIARLNPIFEETWATRIEGRQYEYYHPFAIGSRPRLACDDSGNIYMYGSTASGAVPGTDPIAPFVPNAAYFSNFVHADPVAETPASTYDTYLLKFSPGTDLLHSTLLGGPGQDYAAGITTVGDRVYVCGSTGSALFPTNAPVIPGATPYVVSTPSPATGDVDGFMAQLHYDFTIGMEDVAARHGNGLLLYPNPAAADLTIGGLDAAQGGYVRTLDVLGQEVLPTVRITGSTMTIATDQLARGCYLVHAVTRSGMRTARFVKE